MVQQPRWAMEHIPLFQWYSSQAGLGDLSCCLACHWVAALHDYLRNPYIQALTDTSCRILSLDISPGLTLFI